MEPNTKSMVYKLVGLSFILYVIWMMVVFDLLAVPGARTAHFVEEIVGGIISFIVAYIAYQLFQKTSLKYNMIVSLAFLAAGIIDIIHGLFSFGILVVPLSPPDVFIPGTWVAGRIMLSLILLFNLSIGDEKAYEAEKKSEFILWGSLVFGFSSVIFALFSLFRMPAFILPEVPIIHRPWELIALLFFLLAFRYYYKKGIAENASILQKLMVPSIIIGIFVQLVMVGSSAVFDGMFNLAHVLKDVSYLLPAFVIFFMGGRNEG